MSERVVFLGTARVRIQSVPLREYRTNMYTEKRREASEIEAEIDYREVDKQGMIGKESHDRKPVIRDYFTLD